jgi:hypothetical protein
MSIRHSRVLSAMHLPTYLGTYTLRPSQLGGTGIIRALVAL